MDTLVRKKIVSAFLKALLFTVVMMLLKIIWRKTDGELDTLFDTRFFIFYTIILFAMFLVYYLTADKNPTWKDVFNVLKKTKK